MKISRLFTQELKSALSSPWKLPLGLLNGAIFTFFGFFVAVVFHYFHDTLPYVGASLFVWTLASVNATQVATYNDESIKHLSNKKAFIEICLVKNLILLVLAIPIVILFVIIACWLLNDFSDFGLALLLSIAAVILSLGLGNIVPILWAYKPKPIHKIWRSRVELLDFGIFSMLSYFTSSLALFIIATLASVIVALLGTKNILNLAFGTIILSVLASLGWYVAVNIAYLFFQRHSEYVVKRLKGESLVINNKRLKKILKITN